jgi:hypothetical protein
MGQGVPDSGLGGKVDDVRYLGMLLRDGFHADAFADICPVKDKAWKFCENSEPGFFEGRVVVVIDDVDSDDGFAALKQSVASVKTNKTGDAGYEI